MIFECSCELHYEVTFPSTLILSVHAHRNSAQSVLEERFSVEPEVKVTELAPDKSGNRFVRISTGDRKTLAVHYETKVECDYQLLIARDLEATPIAELTTDELPYLFPSRYCQSDKLGRLAWDLFGSITNPHEQVSAIAEWIHDNVDYVRGSTNSETSAYDTVTQRTGVCRDFAHLGIALSRALNIPARYFTGYAYELQPPDMHACFECFIAGSWTIYDPTRLSHLNGLVRVGVGRDAADAAVASIFGGVNLQSMKIDCHLAKDQEFEPLKKRHISRHAVQLPTQSI
jgi:transglutaminase-like putative cysteine protease